VVIDLPLPSARAIARRPEDFRHPNETERQLHGVQAIFGDPHGDRRTAGAGTGAGKSFEQWADPG